MQRLGAGGGDTWKDLCEMRSVARDHGSNNGTTIGIRGPRVSRSNVITGKCVSREGDG